MEENNINSPAEEKKEGAQPSPARSAPGPKPGIEAKKGMGKARQFFRSLLIWLGVIAAAFLAGVGTYHFARYVPTSKSLGEAQSALEIANSELGTLRADKQKSDEIISALQDELNTANAHVEILQLLADANEARLALIAKDVEGAKIALESSPETLDSILPLIAEIDADLAQSMSQRLGLIVSGLERDSASAQIDLELFAKDLLAAEEGLSN